LPPPPKKADPAVCGDPTKTGRKGQNAVPLALIIHADRSLA
jgi:hypothetical protein